MSDRAAGGGRYGYWFPLVLLGFGLLGLLGWDSVRTGQDFGWVAYAPWSSDAGSGGTELLVGAEYPWLPEYRIGAVRFETALYPMRDWPWAALGTATLVATVAWYGRRARRAGGSVRAYVALAVGGGVAVLSCYAAAGIADAVADPAGLVGSAGLPLTGLGALTGAWAYLRRGRWRRTATMISAACLAIGAGMILGAWSPGLLDPVIIAGGLLALARLERSRLLAIVAGAVLVAMLVFPVGTLSMLIPAAIMLAAAIMALVRQAGVAGVSADPA